MYRPADRTALAAMVAALTIGSVAAWPARLLPHVPCWDARPRQPSMTPTPTALLTAEQLYAVAPALLVDVGESFVHTQARHRSRAAYEGRSVLRPTNGAPGSVSAPASGTRAAERPLPDPSKESCW